MNRVSRIRQVRRYGAVLSAAALVALVLAPIAQAVHDEDFELDGNVANTAGGAQTIDWEDLFTDPDKTKTGGANAPVAVDPLPGDHTVASFIEDWSLNANGTFNTSDPTTFTTGAKDINDVNTWRCVGANNVTNKGDLTNVYATIADDGTSTFIYFGAEKTEDNGDNNIGIWLLQGSANCPTPASGNGNAFVGTHADGDIFLVSAFTNGGGVSTITAYAWSTNLDGDATPNEPGDVGLDPDPVAVSADCILSVANPNFDDRLCATTNRQATKTPATFNPEWSHYSKLFGVNNGLERSTFFEGGIEISGFNQFADECFSTILVNTRSSQELTATLYDYAAGPLGSCDVSLTSTPSLGSGGSTSLGSNTAVTDLAVVTGTSTGGGSAPDPTGTVTFFLCGPGVTSCTTGGSPIPSDPPTAVTLGNCSPDVAGAQCATSPNVRSMLTAVGTYCFRAVYNPGDDPNYAGKTAEDGSSGECFSVTDTSSGSTAQRWLPNDSATFTSGGGSTLAGSVEFTMYASANCTGTVLFQETRNAPGNSSSFTVGTTNGDGSGTGLAADKSFSVSDSPLTISWKAIFTSTNSTSGSAAPCETSTLTIDDDITVP